MDWPSDWALIVSAIVLGVYVIGTWKHGFFKKRGIPFIKPLPFVGNLGSFALKKKSVGDNIVEIYNHFKGHSVCGFFQFSNPMTIILDPELLRLITVKDFDHFTDHFVVVRENDDPLFGKNIFALQGQRWREMRNTLSPAFTSSKMKSMFLLVQETGNQLSDYLEERCRETKDGFLTLEMKDLFTRYTNDVIATTAFGLRCDSLKEQNNDFYLTGKSVTDFGGLQGLKFLVFFAFPALMNFFKASFLKKSDSQFFRDIVLSTLATRKREGIVRPDMIHLLMQAQKGTLNNDVDDEVTDERATNEKEIKKHLTDDDVTANALLFFLAGFDTSSTLLCFMSHLLAVHPDIQARVHQEVEKVLKEDEGKLTYEGMKKMKYLDMVISETLRLYPPAVASDRVCVKPYVIPATANTPEVKLQTGDAISIPIIGIQRDSDYHEDPMKFDPERFSEENKHNIKPFTYMPFGLGPRVCIGQRFALMEAKVAFCSLLSRFTFEVVSQTQIPIVLHKKSFNMGAEGGFWLGMRPRASATA